MISYLYYGEVGTAGTLPDSRVRTAGLPVADITHFLKQENDRSWELFGTKFEDMNATQKEMVS